MVDVLAASRSFLELNAYLISRGGYAVDIVLDKGLVDLDLAMKYRNGCYGLERIGKRLSFLRSLRSTVGDAVPAS